MYFYSPKGSYESVFKVGTHYERQFFGLNGEITKRITYSDPSSAFRAIRSSGCFGVETPEGWPKAMSPQGDGFLVELVSVEFEKVVLALATVNQLKGVNSKLCLQADGLRYYCGDEQQTIKWLGLDDWQQLDKTDRVKMTESCWIANGLVSPNGFGGFWVSPETECRWEILALLVALNRNEDLNINIQLDTEVEFTSVESFVAYLNTAPNWLRKLTNGDEADDEMSTDGLLRLGIDDPLEFF